MLLDVMQQQSDGRRIGKRRTEKGKKVIE